MIEGKEVRRPAVPAEDMMQAFAYRHLVPVQELQVAVAGSGFARGAVQILSDLPVKIPVGGTARIQFTTVGNAAVNQIRLSEAPEGIEIQKITPTRGGVEMVLSSDPAKVKPGLQGNLILVAAARMQRAARGRPPSIHAVPISQRCPPCPSRSWHRKHLMRHTKPGAACVAYGLVDDPSRRRRLPHWRSKGGSSRMGNLAARFSSRSMPSPGRSLTV